MKKYILFIILLVMLAACENRKEAVITEQQKQEMRTTAADFMKQLKSILINQIQTNGVVSAVSVCSDTAQVLTNNFGLQKGVFVKRVSFRNRNKNNYPDDFESKILSKFSTLHRNGELDNKTEYIETVTENDIKYLRYIKPIFIQGECLYCHGSSEQISAEVNKVILSNYPDDKALNYRLGDLRGAVSIKKVIE